MVKGKFFGLLASIAGISIAKYFWLDVCTMISIMYSTLEVQVCQSFKNIFLILGILSFLFFLFGIFKHKKKT